MSSDGLREEIQRAQVEVVIPPDDASSSSSVTREELADYDFDALGTVDAVVVGHDTDFDFRKLCLATNLLHLHPRAQLVATNLDAYDLVGAAGRHLPGNGSLVAAVAAASGRQVVDCGKPSAPLADYITAVLGLKDKDDRSRTVLFVGDRLDTDIRFAVQNGMHAAAVLTGVTTVAQLQALTANDDTVPTIVFPHVGYLAG